MPSDRPAQASETGRVREVVAEFVRRRFGNAVRGELGFDDPLFSSGVVDSFGVLELIAFLEETFKVVIDPAKHDLEEFDTVSRIVSVVERARGTA